MPVAIPSVNFTVLSNGLGNVPPSVAGTVGLFGVSSGGTANVVSGPYRRVDNLVTDYGYGPGIELAANCIESAIPVIWVKVATNAAGASSAVTFEGSGTSVMTVSGAPFDYYDEIIVTVVRSGTAGTDPEPGFTISLDGGETESREIRMPANRIYSGLAATTGLTLTFTAATLVVGDTYTFSTTAPTWAAADVATAIQALKADARNAAILQVEGACTKAQSDTIMSAVNDYLGRKKFIRTLLSTRDIDTVNDETEAEWMTSVSNDFAAFSNDRGIVMADPARVQSTISGTKFRRVGHLMLPRAGRRSVSRDIGAGEDGALCPKYAGTNTTGPLGGVPIDTVYHDETLNPGLNENRFATIGTIEGLTGYYVVNPMIMTSPTSDFDLLQLGRVMDEACRVANTFFAPKLSTDVRLNRTTGFILEKDARALESGCDSALNRAVVDRGDASFVQTIVSRTDDITTTKPLTVTIKTLRLGYLKTIDLTITFFNPALGLVA